MVGVDIPCCAQVTVCGSLSVGPAVSFGAQSRADQRGDTVLAIRPLGLANERLLGVGYSPPLGGRCSGGVEVCGVDSFW